MKVSTIIEKKELTNLNEWFKFKSDDDEEETPEQKKEKQKMLTQIGKWWEAAQFAAPGRRDPFTVIFRELESLDDKPVSSRIKGFAIPGAFATSSYKDVLNVYNKLLNKLPKEITKL